MNSGSSNLSFSEDDLNKEEVDLPRPSIDHRQRENATLSQSRRHVGTREFAGETVRTEPDKSGARRGREPGDPASLRRK